MATIEGNINKNLENIENKGFIDGTKDWLQADQQTWKGRGVTVLHTLAHPIYDIKQSWTEEPDSVKATWNALGSILRIAEYIPLISYFIGVGRLCLGLGYSIYTGGRVIRKLWNGKNQEAWAAVKQDSKYIGKQLLRGFLINIYPVAPLGFDIQDFSLTNYLLKFGLYGYDCAMSTETVKNSRLGQWLPNFSV